MTTRTYPDDVRVFLDRVRERLADLPTEEREDLLADVEPSVLESAEDSDVPVELRLGPPERFADELRAAAGLPPVRAVRPRLRERVSALMSEKRRRRLRELAPLWWVARAYVAVALLAVFTGSGRSTSWPGLAAFGTGAAGGFVLAAAVVASVAAGLHRRPRGRAWSALNVVLALALLPVLAAVESRDTSFAAYPVDPLPQAGLSYDGVAVRNVFAYDRRGRLLYDVRLYAGDGRPLEVGRGAHDPDRRIPRTKTGKAALNAFPVRYFAPGTTRVAKPAAGAPARPAPLVTRPVK
jgi:hypothetical protein